jgi:flagellar FliJ protein
MAKHNPLNTLIDLAKNDADEAAKQLQRLMGGRNEAAQQLSMLQEYRQDYAERLHKAAEIGLSASNYHNFRQFIATLDEAISLQNGVVAQIDLKLENGRRQWQSEKRRLNSFETLVTRQARQQTLRDNRNEQRANDEISANQFRRMQNAH